MHQSVKLEISQLHPITQFFKVALNSLFERINVLKVFLIDFSRRDAYTLQVVYVDAVLDKPVLHVLFLKARLAGHDTHMHIEIRINPDLRIETLVHTFAKTTQPLRGGRRGLRLIPGLKYHY